MPELAVVNVKRFRRGELAELCEATAEAIRDGIGFGWVQAPARHRLEAYWRGVLLVPERELFIGRIDGAVGGSIQLVKPAPNFEAGHFAAHIDTHFVAPWARGHGLARRLLDAAEARAREEGFSVMRLDVRATAPARCGRGQGARGRLQRHAARRAGEADARDRALRELWL
jgi:ribosomal protein S18 acetylase RimI-like enzyme